MMRSPDGRVLFIEVCKNASTACARHLGQAGWRQLDGTRNPGPPPGSHPGRHAYLTPAGVQWARDRGVTVLGVVRNPWDRVASLWRSQQMTDGIATWWRRNERIKLGGVDFKAFSQTEWLRGAAHVLRYEQLEDDWRALTRAGLLPDIPATGLPKVNAPRLDGPTPTWTSELIESVHRAYAIDIERWAYSGPS